MIGTGVSLVFHSYSDIANTRLILYHLVLALSHNRRVQWLEATSTLFRQIRASWGLCVETYKRILHQRDVNIVNDYVIHCRPQPHEKTTFSEDVI